MKAFLNFTHDTGSSICKMELIPCQPTIDFLDKLSQDYINAAYNKSFAAKDLITDSDEFEMAAAMLKEAQSLLEFGRNVRDLVESYEEKLEAEAA